MILWCILLLSSHWFISFFCISDSVVICTRSIDSVRDFNNVQNFCVIELGLPFIPIGENINRHISQVILQLINVSNPSKRRKNPFKFGTLPQNKKDHKKANIVETADQQICKTIQTIPGMGEKKARLLIQKFGSLYDISNQPAETLAKVVGVATANSTYNFFRS